MRPATSFKASCMPQHTCVACLLTFSLFCRRTAEGARQPCQFESVQCQLQSNWRRVVCSNIHMLIYFANILTCFAGELPKELGKLVNLKILMLQLNGFTGTIVCPVLHSRTLVKHITSCICYCTVTNEETTALEAKLPKCDISF